MTWGNEVLVGFDLETTSADPDEARIVTASIVIDDGDGHARVHEWLVDPGIPIPDEAAAIHGITTEIAVTDGIPPQEALAQIVEAFKSVAGAPVVIFNAQFDCTVLARELERHGLDPYDIYPVVDPYVLDKQFARYRKGGRKLVDLSQVYDVPLNNAHTSTGDVLCTIGLARAMNALAAFPEPSVLHARQKEWKREQQESLAAYFARQGRTERVATEWPVVPKRGGGNA